MHTQPLPLILVVALCTMLTRFLPFLAFPAGRKRPAFILYLSRALPPAVIGLLVVYCLRQVQPLPWPHGLPELIAILIVAFSYLWKRNTLISIGLGTLVYMILIRLMV